MLLELPLGLETLLASGCRLPELDLLRLDWAWPSRGEVASASPAAKPRDPPGLRLSEAGLEASLSSLYFLLRRNDEVAVAAAVFSSLIGLLLLLVSSFFRVERSRAEDS